MINLRLLISTLLLLTSLSAFSEDGDGGTGEPLPNPVPPPPAGQDAEKPEATYLKYLGQYIGYDITTASPSPVYSLLLDVTIGSILSSGLPILTTFFESLPINGKSLSFSTGAGYDSFNDQANVLFEKTYPEPDGSPMSVTKDFDQQEYQSDPVSQAVLNLVGTPDWSSCPPVDTTSAASSKSICLSRDMVMSKVLQSIDEDKLGENEYFAYDNNKEFISQLNSNNLIGPMLYTTTAPKAGEGLPAENQAQLAQAFIRYATEGVLPLQTMSNTDYGDLYTIATTPTEKDGKAISGIDVTNIMNAKVALANYLLNLRVYAAKSSVAISNFYYILSRRLPPAAGSTDGGEAASTTTTSQALNEFQMATWRLYNPKKTESSEQWVKKINTATPASVQKEMAILLAEINYQLYLNRQQQERLLMTNSMMLLQILSTNKPSYDFPGNVEKDSSATPGAPPIGN